MKEDINSFHMRHSSLICSKRLLSYESCKFLSFLCLVYSLLRSCLKFCHDRGHPLSVYADFRIFNLLSPLVVQGWAKMRAPGLVDFVPAVANHFCLNLPRKFSQPWAHFLAQPCTLFGTFCSTKSTQPYIMDAPL